TKSAGARPKPLPELPRGGRRLFPRYRIVAYYGAPQNVELGALGIGTPAQAGKRLLAQMRPYRRGRRRLLPAMELIAVVASGSAPAAVVNRVSGYLAGIVRRYRLPEKLLVVHEFTDSMIRDRPSLRRRRGVALVLNVDGFGDPPNKIARYDDFNQPRSRFHRGFKVFYKEDTNMMSPQQVLQLRPR